MITTIALVFTLVFYAPACKGINGGGRHFANGDVPTPQQHKLVVACGRKYAFGQKFLIHGMEEQGITEVVCKDRGGWITNNKLDVFIMTGEGCAADRRMARLYGRKIKSVEVIGGD